MSPSRARYVTACQQLLALGVVVIALVPATRVVSLDVVGVRPGQGVAQPTISVSPIPEAGMSGFARGDGRCAAGRVASRVAPRVAERGSTTRVADQPCRVRDRLSGPRTRAGAG